MKYLYIILILISCKKQAEDILPVINPVDVNLNVIISTDTVLSNNDGKGKVLRIEDGGKIKSGILSHWVIDAPYGNQIFDTSVTLINCTVYNSDNVFNCNWFGLKQTNQDNYGIIQKSINTAAANGMRCKLPLGVYNTSKTIDFEFIYKNAYVGCTFYFFGESSFWGSNNGSCINYTANKGSAINVQLNKGTEIYGITLRGQWKSPQTPDMPYFNTSYENYKDVSGKNCGDDYVGISIDGKKPIDGVNNNGSTGLKIHDMDISGFTHLIAISQNGITRNADNLLFDGVHLGDGKDGFINGQGQEKGNVIRRLSCWGSLHTVFANGTHGLHQSGDYYLDGANIAGRVIRLFDISESGWFNTSINKWFCESIATIGSVQSANLPISFTNCTFDFNFISRIGVQTLLISNSYAINFRSCIFRYNNGGSEDMKFFGYATFDEQCKFSGKRVY